MGSAQQVAIDPTEVRRSAGQLRLRADNADDISGEATRALFRAGLSSSAPSALSEVDEELHLLAEILVQRANMVDSNQLTLALYPWSHVEQLWESLVDGDGATAIIAGDNALVIVRQHADDLDTDGDGLIGLTELRAAADDPTHPALAAAATSLLGSQSTLDALVAATDAEIFFVPELAISTSALSDLLATNDTLRRDAVTAASALADGKTTVEIDGKTVDATKIVADAINNQVFSHDAGSAYEFLQLLPNSASGVPGFSIFAAQTDTVQSLYDAAMTDVAEDDFLTRFSIVTQMPETTDGIRNHYITELYALASTSLEGMVNPDQMGDPTQPGHGGTTWPTWGAAASNTVKGAITGDTTILGRPPTNIAKQLMADGNQEIATTILGKYFEFVEIFGDGDITDTKVTDFLNSFDEGERELQIAFALQLAAMTTDDPTEKQKFQLQSNIAVSVYEQAVIDDELDFNRLEIEARIGAHALTAVISIASGDLPPTSKSVAEIMTEHGKLELEAEDGEGTSFELDEPIPPGPEDNNLIDDLDLSDELNPANYELSEIDIPGIEQVEPVSGIDTTTGLSGNSNDWTQPSTPVSDWTTYGQRMSVVADLLHKHHVNPAAYENVDVILDR